uniref:Uncharacterized protein n=1 Tax=Setaria italica TaxID=4555 RepID=K3YFI3_SETIT
MYRHSTHMHAMQPITPYFFMCLGQWHAIFLFILLYFLHAPSSS